MVNDSFVPPRPSPAMLASADCTSVNVDGRVVVSDPTIGMTTCSSLVICVPVPSSKLTEPDLPVMLVTL